MDKKSVLCFGEMLWDKISPTNKQPGGAPMNVALHLLKHGHDVCLVSRVGNDSDGCDLLDFIRPSGLSLDYIQRDATVPTGVVNVVLDEKQNATYDIVFPSAWDFIQLDEPLMKKMESVDAIVFGSLASRNDISRNTLFYLFKSKAIKIFDVNLRAPYYSKELLEDMMLVADIIKLNHEEIAVIASWYGQHALTLEDQMRWLSKQFGCGTLCVTRAEHGAAMLHNNLFTEHPGFHVKVEDTIGSGDAFLASFIHGIFQEDAPYELLSNACRLGAYVATRKGANPEYEIEEIKII
ncbi:MAG: carbohydrate kinase family protein [Microbacter sp.]